MTQPTGTFEKARQFFLDGLAHYQAGRMEAAERAFAASLALVPGRPSTLTNLGAARLKLGRADEAVVVLREATVAEPANAEAWGHLAAGLAELGQPGAALDAAARAVQLQPANGAAWLRPGLRNRSRRGAAAAALRPARGRGPVGGHGRAGPRARPL